MKVSRLLNLCLMLAMILGSLSVPTTTMAQAPAPGAEIESALLDALAEGSADFVVVMRERADLSRAAEIADWSARGHYVYDTLLAVARTSQAPVVKHAEAEGLAYRSFLTTNAVYIEQGSLKEAQTLATVEGVAQIRLPKEAFIEPDYLEADPSPDTYGWNLDTLDPGNDQWGMQASQVWDAYGVRGEGIVVANIDTGANYLHEALDRQYRGNLAGSVGGPYDHDFNWYMPTSGCGDGTYPCDNNGHGSGTAGIMVGETADLTEQLGVAPAAKWIACKGCESSSCSEAALTGCADWMVAPCPVNVDPGDPSCDPDKRPHIVNNSWGGGSCDPWYDGYVAAWVASGIFPAFSAGNSSGCSTLGSPGDTPDAFGTAAHSIYSVYPSLPSGTNIYAGGPSCYYTTPTCDPLAHDIDPHVNAPTYGRAPNMTPGTYFNLGGTSGASPHTAGAVALIWSGNPTYVGQILDTFYVLEQSANRNTLTPACGKPACAGANIWPNYSYGWGYLDAFAAVTLAGVGGQGALQGTVTDGLLEAPLEGITVSAERLGGGGKDTTTDLTGYYTMTLVYGTYTVTAEGPQYGPETITGVTIVTGAVTTLDIVLDPKGFLEGTVTDADSGVPLEAMVSISPTGEAMMTDPATGYYSMYLPAGDYDVTAAATDYASQTVPVNITSGGAHVQNFALLAAVAVVPDPISITLELETTGSVGAVMTNNMSVGYPFEFSVLTPIEQGLLAEDVLVVRYDTTAADAMQTALTAAGYTYLGVTSTQFEAMTVPDLLQYRAVFYAGIPYATSQTLLMAYLDAGGSLYVSDNDLGWSQGSTTFYQTYLQAIYLGDDPGIDVLIGQDIMSGLTLDISADWYPDYFSVAAEGAQIFTYQGSANAGGVAVDRNGYKAIYTSFDFYFIADPLNANELVDRVMAYLGGGGTLTWFVPDIMTGTVPAYSSLPWNNAFYATAAAGIVQPGTYEATLRVDPTTGGLPRKEVGVVMNVLPTAFMGLLEGTTTSDRPGGALESGILIEDSTGYTYTLTSDPDTGYYSFWLDETYGPFTLTVSADGYFSETRATDVTAGLTTTEDFELVLIAPEIAVDPLSMDVALNFGDMLVEPLTITNDGPVALTWEIREGDEAYSPTAGEDILIVNDGDTNATAAFSQAAGNLGYSYLVVDTATFLGMPVDDLLEYQAVIFVHYPSTGTEQDHCMAYLDAGGSFLVADNDFGYFEGTSTLYQTYLQATYVSDAGSDGIITGVDIMAGLSGDISTDPYPDDFTLGPDGIGIFEAPSGNWAGSRIEINGYKAVYLAWDYYYIGGSAVGDQIETDVLEAALGWLAAGDILWLSQDPITGTIPAFDSAVVDVTFDAGVVPDPGVYMANLKIRHNDPLNPQVVVPVTMTVSPTPNIGKLEGTVTSDRPGGPLEADVLIEDSLGMTWTVGTDPDTGFYYRWLLTGTYTVTASADGYLPDWATVVVPSMGTVVQDFELIREAGQIEVEPLSMQEVLTFGLTAVQYLTISNVGYADLNYELVEADRGGPIVEGESYPSLAVDGGDLTDANPNAVFGGAFEIKGAEAWGTGTAMPGAGRYRAGSVSDDCNRIFVIGGDTGATGSADVMLYDSTTDTWTTLANKPRAGMSWQPMVIDGLIYVAGGYNGAHNNWLDIYDPAANTWSAGANMPSATTPMAAAIDGILYVFGGNPGPSANVAKYDPATDTWTAGLAAMPTARSYGRAIAAGGYAYVLGGAINGGQAFERYDPAADSWTVGPNLPVARGDMSLFLVGDYLYAEGGINDYAGWAGVTTVERYYLPDFPTAAWETMPAAPSAFGAAAYACASDKMWSIGGQDATATAVTTNRYHDEGLPCQCGAGGEVDWLSEDPSSGTVPSMDDAVVEVTFDAGMVPEPGTYLANLNVNSDDPYNPRVTVQVTLTVLPSADLGQLEGTVTGLGYCDAESYPAAGAMVHVEDGLGGSWDLEADNDGYYSRWFEAGTYTLTVSTDGHVDGLAVTEIVSGTTTVEDFALRWIGPCMDVTPLTFSVELFPDSQFTETLSIINDGAGDLMWEILETTATLPLMLPLVESREVVIGDLPFTTNPNGMPGFSRTPASGMVPADEVMITHSASQSIISLNSVSCNASGLHTDNSYLRWFTLADFGITGAFNVTHVEIGIETASGATGSQPATMNLYTWDPATAFVWANLTQIGTAATTVADQDLTILDVPVAGTVPAGGTLVVEFFTPNGQTAGNSLFVGSNNLGQTGLTYLAAVDCGVPEPLDTGGLGFPGMHLVLNVYGEEGGGQTWLDVPWVSEVPTTGITLGDDMFDVDVIFDSTGLTAGECYTASLGLFHDDPGWDNPTLIPLELCVVECVEVADVELSVVTAGPIYPGDVVEFSADMTPPDMTMPFDYSIDMGDGSPLIIGSTDTDPMVFTHTFALADTYTVTIEIMNCAMAAPVIDTVQVVVESENYYIYLPIVFKNN